MNINKKCIKVVCTINGKEDDCLNNSRIIIHFEDNSKLRIDTEYSKEIYIGQLTYIINKKIYSIERSETSIKILTTNDRNEETIYYIVLPVNDIYWR